MDFLGGDFSLELDDILDPEQTGSEEQNNDNDSGEAETPNESTKKPKAKTKNTTTTEVSDDDDDPFGIDMSLAFEDPEAEEDDDQSADIPGTEEENDNTESTPDGSSSTISAFASALFEQGAFPDLDEEEIKKVKTPEDLIALNRKQIETNEFRDLSDLQKEALKAFRAGIDPATFAKLKGEEMRFDNISDEQLSDEDVSKSVIEEYLRLNNTPKDVIEDLIESYSIDEKLTSKAKEALPKIKSILKDNQTKYEQSITQERENTINSIKTSLEKTKEIISGIEITEKEKNELFNQMTRPAKILDDGTQLDIVMVKRQEDPMSFMLKLHYYAKLGLFDREVKTDLLKRKVKTNALKDFEDKLNSGNSSNKVKGGSASSRANDLYNFDDIPDIKFNN